jgi:hypothetical protein
MFAVRLVGITLALWVAVIQADQAAMPDGKMSTFWTGLDNATLENLVPE